MHARPARHIALGDACAGILVCPPPRGGRQVVSVPYAAWATALATAYTATPVATTQVRVDAEFVDGEEEE